jgi:hypothetical protein
LLIGGQGQVNQHELEIGLPGAFSPGGPFAHSLKVVVPVHAVKSSRIAGSTS